MNHRSGWPRHLGDRKEQGSALLAVLGVSAVLAVLGFSMSSSVGGALDKVALQLDTTQAYYLSQGGIQAAMQEMSFEAGARSQLPTGRQVRRYRFKSGNVEVEIVSEAGKLGINQVSQDVFSQLLIRMGVPTQKAEILASSVIDYRKKLQQGNSQDYQLNSMFSSRASPRNYSAAIQEVEELLALPGFTEDIVYGTTKRSGPHGSGFLELRLQKIGVTAHKRVAALFENATSGIPRYQCCCKRSAVCSRHSGSTRRTNRKDT